MLLASSRCRTDIILTIAKSLVICQRLRCFSSLCSHWLWSWCVDFSESSSQIQEAVWELFFFFMSCKSLLCATLLNAFFSFKLSSETTLLFISLYTMCIFSVISCRVVFVDLCLQVLIWMFNIKLHVSTTFCKHSNMMNFSILLSMLNSTIDLYIFALK